MNIKAIRYLILVISIILLFGGCSRTSVPKKVESENKPVSINTQPQEEDTASTKETAPVQESNNIENKDNKSPATDDKSLQSTGEANRPSEVKGKGKIIVIDPGHGGKSTSEKEPVSPDSNELKLKNVSGATGITTKTPEAVIALSVSEKLKGLLEKEGYTVIMTRTTGNETIGNIARAEIGNKSKADLVIRIHADSSDNKSIQGASMLVPGDVGYAKGISSTSKQYGQTILNSLKEYVGMKSRGVVTRADLTGFNWSKVPVVLIEMGFLSNPDEDKLLASDDYQEKIAIGLERGIDNALSK